MTSAEATQEYRAEAEKWQLPAGRHWPAVPLAQVAPDGVAISYGLEYGKVEATHYWFCAWSHELLKAENEQERSKALEKVRRVHETAYYRAIDDTSHLDRAISAAAIGDLSRVAEQLKLNCRVLE